MGRRSGGWILRSLFLCFWATAPVFALAPDPASAQSAEQLAHAKATPDDKSAADEAFRRFVALRARVRAGGGVPPAFAGVEHWLALAARATDPRVAELFRRVFEDQFIRLAGQGGGEATFAQGLSKPARTLLDWRLGAEMVAVDAANTDWLRRQLGDIEWFGIRRFGAEADNGAWFLVQHADADPDFQERVLGRLESLVATGDTSRRHYAYLFDRVALARGRPQRYGTQMTCAGPGVWKSRPVEAPETLDARRAEVGLPPEADYAKMGSRFCQ
jgi:hypothetical protein